MADEQFEAALRLVLQDELTNALRNTQARSNQAAKNIEKGWRGAFTGMKKGMQEAQRTIQRGQQQIRSGALTMAAGVGMAAPLALAAKAAGTFQDGMAEIATLTNQSAKEITVAFGPIVNETRRAFGKDAQNTIKALYDGFSAGVPKTQEAAREYLNAAGQMALGGKTDMAAAADAITTVRNAWEFEGLSFKEIVDQTFVGVQEGKTTVTELSASMGQAAATVAGARVPYSEFIGAVAALTSAGVKTPQAMTQISMAVSSLVKPSVEAQKIFKKVRAEIDPLTLSQKGLGGTLEYLTGQVNAYTTDEAERKELIGKMFGSIEALKAVTLLAGDSNEKFKTSTDKAVKGVDAMGTAADKMREGPMHRYRQAVQDSQIAWETFGSVTAPIFADLLETIAPLIENVTTWIDENRELVSGLAVAALWISALVVTFGALKVAMGIATVIKGVTMALWSMNSALMANPIVLLATLAVAGLAAIIAFVVLAVTHWDEFTMAVQVLGLEIRILFNTVQEQAYKGAQAISEFLRPVHELLGIKTTDWSLNIKEQREDIKRDEGKIDALLVETRRVMERREELEAQKSGKGGGFNMGDLVTNVNIPQGFGRFGGSDVIDPDGLAKKIAKENELMLKKMEKQKKREKIGK